MNLLGPAAWCQTTARENRSPYTDKAIGEGARILAAFAHSSSYFSNLLRPCSPLGSQRQLIPLRPLLVKRGFVILAGRFLILVIEFFSLILYSDHHIFKVVASTFPQHVQKLVHLMHGFTNI